MNESSSLKRPRFFSGKLVTPEDLELEQQYFREKLKRHNRSLHGFGIVSGLKVSVSSGQIVVEPGLALDCEGNEVIVDTEQSILTPASFDKRNWFVNVRFVDWDDDKDEALPTYGSEEVCNAATMTEGFLLAVSVENLNRRHRHLRARWLACGQAHALTIAKLKNSSHGWRVDRAYRVPVIK
jgi:hypothetical protein